MPPRPSPSAIRSFQPQFLLLVAAVAALTYLPFTDLPPLPDDYLQAELGQRLLDQPGWLLQDPLYRCRATSIALTAATLKWFGFSATAFTWTSILLHCANAILVYLLGSIRWIGWRVSLVAALVFAAGERHHEAVIWYAALPDLLVFGFAVASLLGWLRWLEGGRLPWLALAAAGFAFALVSKESGVLLCAVFPLLCLVLRERRPAPWIAAAIFLGCGAAYFAGSWLARDANQHYRDGTFALTWNVLPVLLRSTARSLWAWGALALFSLWTLRRRIPRAVLLAAVWLPAALLPYSFLTYTDRVPSRHHYAAGLAVALLIGLAFWHGRRRWLRGLTGLAVLVFVLHNWGYLWTYKKQQFWQRAEPLEAYLRQADTELRQGRPRPPWPMQNMDDEVLRALRFRLNAAGR